MLLGCCHVLFVNQMCCCFDQVQQLVNITSPFRQDGLGGLRGKEADNILGPINFRVHASVTNHTRDLLFQAGWFQLQSCAKRVPLMSL